MTQASYGNTAPTVDATKPIKPISLTTLQEMKKNVFDMGIISDNSTNGVMPNNEDPGYSEKDYMDFLNKS